MTNMQDDARLPKDAKGRAGSGSVDAGRDASEPVSDEGHRKVPAEETRERAGEALERATAALGTDEER